MVKVIGQNEEEASLVNEENLISNQENEEEIALVLQKLANEETCLREQFENLSSLKEQLQKKAKEELEIKKASVEKLKSEIASLKGECEKLTKSLRLIQSFQ